MIRASSMHRLCTNRPQLPEAAEVLKVTKALQKGCLTYLKEEYDSTRLEEYCATKGVATNAKKLHALRQAEFNARLDPLPKGAQTYAKELWLELNRDIYLDTRSGEAGQMTNGKLQEDGAIEILSLYTGTAYSKNTVRKTHDFNTGEEDLSRMYSIPEGNVLEIRDIKVPKGPRAFRSKSGIPDEYYWQLIDYADLCSRNQEGIVRIDLYLDYILMPLHPTLLQPLLARLNPEDRNRLLKTETAIINAPLHERIKSYRLECDLTSEIAFMRSRIEKFTRYYSTLNYEICMNYPR